LNSTNHNHHSYSKPPTGRSRSPSLTRVNGITNRSRSSARSQSLTRSCDSDVGSRVSFDVYHSEIDDSGNGKIKF
ncbi:unnamed protein product, partial [Rotaria magnacalcarata]